MVEPLAGLFGAVAMVLAEPLLPYALAFAAGAMVYVVMDDIIPEAQLRWAISVDSPSRLRGSSCCLASTYLQQSLERKKKPVPDWWGVGVFLKLDIT